MTVLRNIAITFLVIIVVGLVVGVVYIKTIDINKHLPAITQEIHRLTGRVVSIKQANMDVSFTGGLELVVDGLFISEDETLAVKQPFIEIDQLAASINWLKFLQKKEISFGEITLRKPSIKIIRLASGEFNFSSIEQHLAQANKGAVDNTAKVQGAMPLLFIDDINIEDAQIIIDDQLSGLPPIELNSLNVGVTQFSLLNPFKVIMKGALFSDQQNITLGFNVDINAVDQSAEITDLKGNVVLDSLSLRALDKFGLADLKLIKPFSGSLDVSLAQVFVSSVGLSPWQADVLLNNITVSSSLAPESVTALTGKIVLNQDDLIANNISFAYGAGTVAIQSVIENYVDPTNAQVSAKADFTNIEISSLPQVNTLPVGVSGLLNSQATISFKGLDPVAMANSSEVNATINVAQALIKKFNLLAEFVDALAIVPGLNEKVKAELSSGWQNTLTQNYTLIDQAYTSISMEQGVVNIPNISLTTKGFGVTSNGMLNLAQEFSLDALVSVDQELVSKMVSSADKIKLLMESDGSVRIPARIYGKLPNKVHFVLDEGYLTQKLMNYAAQEAVDKLIEKNPEVGAVLNRLFQKNPQHQPPSEDVNAVPDQQTEPNSDSGAKAVEGLLNSLFK